MSSKALILRGGSDKSNGDYSALRDAAVSGRTFTGWSSLKNAKRGDHTFFYITAPNSAIAAMGKILTDAKPGKYWPFEVTVGEIQMLDDPITLEELRKSFPRWKWPGFPRSAVYLDDIRARKLLDRAKRKPLNRDSDLVPQRTGAGFGDPETNGRVERAAVRAVTTHLKQKGFNVISCESEKCGFDLVARKGRQELHIEVKGVQGIESAFVITQNELAAARSDGLFRLAIVTNALVSSRRIEIVTGADFLKRSEVTPISYKAFMKH